MAASAISTLFQPNAYVSRTTLVIGTTILDPNPDSGQIYVAQQLAKIYADMVQREPIQQATMEELGINWLPQYQSKVIPNTQMVEISVTDTNPKRAQIIAGELANQLMQQSPAIAGTETGARQEFIRAQLSSLQVQIQETEKTIEELQKSLVGLNSASQVASIEKEISEQTQKLNNLQENYANFLANSQQGALNILSIVEPANLPTRSVSTNKLVIIALAGLVGFILGTGAAYLLEFLDKTVKTATDIDRIFGLPVIGYISDISENENRATYVSEYPNSVLAENFHLLWSNIEFFKINNPLKMILITSPSPGNGKTTVSSNLALSISQEGQDVLLVDADLRRSAVHSALKMTRGPGLSDVIRKKTDAQEVVRPWKSDGNLKVITAGVVPPNITEVVGSNRIAAVLSELKEYHGMVIIDAPPLIISDSYNLASKADGVIIVMEPGKTPEEQARTIKEQLDRANAKILGFVFNKLSEESMHSYGDYQYRSLYSSKHYGAYNSKATIEPVATSRSKKVIDFFEHGKIPPDMATGVENAISAIKTQPRDMLSRIKKTKKNEKTTEKTSEKINKQSDKKVSEKSNKKENKKGNKKTSERTSKKTSEKKKAKS
jgi:capsular exopolysaccharide synthesis family protein